MQFKVPQNIDMQDRIIGPLTMVQFIYAVVGFGTCYAIFMSIPRPFSYFLIVPIALFVLCLDFVKVNERPFLDFFISAIEYAFAPKQRVWHQGESTDFTIDIYEPQSNQREVKTKYIDHAQIESMAQSADTAGKGNLIRN